jgi:hypothetical protein
MTWTFAQERQRRRALRRLRWLLRLSRVVLHRWILEGYLKQ